MALSEPLGWNLIRFFAKEILLGVCVFILSQ